MSRETPVGSTVAEVGIPPSFVLERRSIASQAESPAQMTQEVLRRPESRAIFHDYNADPAALGVMTEDKSR